ncbi:hypothetical protein EON63_15685, partial [archaeon]
MSLFWEPMPIMIWMAIIIEAILAKWMDMGILLAIQITNASIGTFMCMYCVYGVVLSTIHTYPYSINIFIFLYMYLHIHIHIHLHIIYTYSYTYTYT